MTSYIDLNADLGEGFGAYNYGTDEALLGLVTSANIACGYHGGDPGVMRRAVATAAQRGVVIGAHPGYPDIMGFGRRYMAMAAQDVTDMILYQLGALDGICRAEGTSIKYVKPHGALYNAAAKDQALAAAITEGIRLYSTKLTLLCPAGSELERAAQRAGLTVAREFFADRAYMDDGALMPRSQAGAVLTDEGDICRRVIRAVKEGTVAAASGADLTVKFDSICLHGDNANAVALARAIRSALNGAGVVIKSFVEDVRS